MPLDALTNMLLPLVTAVAETAHCVTHRSHGNTKYNDLAKTEDVHHLILSALFEAYLELGGDADRPDLFEWEKNRGALVHAGVRWLRRELLGRSSQAYLMHRNLKVRKDAHMLDEYRWNAWDNIADVSHRHSARVSTYLAPPEAEKVLFDESVEPFAGELARVLSPTAYRLIVERYRDGIPVSEQVKWVQQAFPKYEGDFKRTSNFIDKTISRARKKAATALKNHWAVVAREVEAKV
jgi:hypothetical protein